MVSVAAPQLYPGGSEAAVDSRGEGMQLWSVTPCP